MNNYKRPLIRGLAAAALAGGICIAGYHFSSSKPQAEPIRAEIVNPAYDDGAVRRLITCPDVDSLAERIPAFANALQDADAEGLKRIYDELRMPMLRMAQDSRLRKNYYQDDLEMLGAIFERMGTKEEKIAVVFLALPRLHDRALSTEWDEPGSISAARSSSERLFLDELGRHEGFSKLAAAIREHWYLKDGIPPDDEGRRELFRAFSASY